MIKTNFHTHSVFCDGKDTPEDIVKTAIEKGFSSIGFSSHSYFTLDEGYCLTPENCEEYKTEIFNLREKYREKINVYCGIEQDYYSDIPAVGYDYIIGSVHFVLKNGEYIAVDLTPENTDNAIKKHYNGDFDSFAEDYFSLVSNVVNKTNADIIGHFDLISKYSEINGYAESARYLAAAEKAVRALIPYNKPFEINTGAMAKGIKSKPYPSYEILKMIKNHGGKVIFSSDAHEKEFLDFGFSEITKMANIIGFDKINTYFK